MQVKSIMTTNIISVKSIMPAHTVFGLIAQHRVHAVPVMDEAYELVGIIAEGDFFLRTDRCHFGGELSFGQGEIRI